MKKTGICPKCGSKDIIADAKAVDHGDHNSENDMQVATFRNPSAFIFKGKQFSTVSAWICVGCGFIEYYADNPTHLKISKE